MSFVGAAETDDAPILADAFFEDRPTALAGLNSHAA